MTAVSGQYIYGNPSLDNTIDYLQYLTEYLRQNPKWTELFQTLGEVITDETENPIGTLARLRSPEACTTKYQLLNNRMLGFNVPNTSYSDNETYITMKTLSNFYITRQASFSFINYLSFIKNTLLEPTTLWGQSKTDTVDDLISYDDIEGHSYIPTNVTIINGGENFKAGDTIHIENTADIVVSSVNGSGQIETYTTTLAASGSSYDISGIITEFATSGDGEGASFNVEVDIEVPSNYFPTVYYDVTYNATDFPIDEAIIKQFIIALQPAHLVFRKFDAITSAVLPISVNPVSQIFSYNGIKFTGSILS